MRSVCDRREPPYRGSADRWDRGAAGLLVTEAFFGPAVPPPELLGGAFWVRTAGGWQKRFPKLWLQGEWHQRLARVWKGSGWVLVNPGETPPGA